MEWRNSLIAVLLSFVILISWDKYFNNSSVSTITTNKDVADNNLKHCKRNEDDADKFNKFNEIKNDEIKNREISVNISTAQYTGTVTVSGGELTGLNLKNYKENINSEQRLSLLSHNRYILENDIILNGNKVNYDWKCPDSKIINESKSLTLTNNILDGIYIKREISFDDKFLVTIKTTVTNNSENKVSVRDKNTIKRKLFSNESNGTWFLNEGGIGYFGDKVIEHTYDKLKKDGKVVYNGDLDWVGFTDKYWLVCLLNKDKCEFNVSYFKESEKKSDNKEDGYIVFSNELLSGESYLEKGQSIIFERTFFVGAKDVDILDGYEKQLNIRHLDLALDYGWLYFITKPTLYVLNLIKDSTGNMVLAILLLTILIKLLLFPFANKSFRSMAKMKNIQPKIKRLQDLYSSDKQRLGLEMIELYKREKVNPLSGIFFSLLQFPILFALYKVLMITVSLRHAKFLWVKDLSEADTCYIFNLFGLLPFNLPSILQVGIWPILMGISMFVQQKMTPQVGVDKSQENMFLLMPVMFVFMMSGLPAGLIIYWTFSNILSMIQQYYINKNTSLKK